MLSVVHTSIQRENLISNDHFALDGRRRRPDGQPEATAGWCWGWRLSWSWGWGSAPAVFVGFIWVRFTRGAFDTIASCRVASHVASCVPASSRLFSCRSLRSIHWFSLRSVARCARVWRRCRTVQYITAIVIRLLFEFSTDRMSCRRRLMRSV